MGIATAALCAPFLQSIFSLADEGVLLAGADRMIHGSRLYADFFEFLPPGGFIITAAWLDLTGISMLSARILAISAIVGIACVTYLVCRTACRNGFYPALVVIAWVVMTQGSWTVISHHWFTMLFSIISAWAALRSIDSPMRPLWEPIVAGLTAGAAAMITETAGALALIAAAAAFVGASGSRQRLSALVCASGVVPAAVFAYILALGSLRAAFDEVIVFAATRYASIQSVPFGHSSTLQNFPLTLLFPVAAVLALRTCVQRWPGCLRDRRFRAYGGFGLAGLIGCFPRPDAAHLGFAAPLAFPLLVYCAKQLGAGRLRNYRGAATCVVALLCVPSGLAYWQIAQSALRTPTTRTARGTVAFQDDPHGTKALAGRIAATPAGDAFFFYPMMSLMSFLTGREQVSRYDVFTPGYSLPSQYREACTALKAQASWVVINRNLTDPDYLRKIFPALRNPEPPETTQFEQFLKTGFRVVGEYGLFELRRRDAAVDQIDCARIAG